MESWSLDKGAQYFHLCQNESIDGIELSEELLKKLVDRVKSEIPDAIITTDVSSSIASRDFSKFDLWQDLGVVYGGAQKNLGTSGLTFVCVRNDVLERVKDIRQNQKIPFPVNMDWTKQASASDKFVNTPSMFSIFTSQLMCEHMLKLGGIEFFDHKATKKSR